MTPNRSVAGSENADRGLGAVGSDPLSTERSGPRAHDPATPARSAVANTTGASVRVAGGGIAWSPMVADESRMTPAPPARSMSDYNWRARQPRFERSADW